MALFASSGAPLPVGQPDFGEMSLVHGYDLSSTEHSACAFADLPVCASPIWRSLLATWFGFLLLGGCTVITHLHRRCFNSLIEFKKQQKKSNTILIPKFMIIEVIITLLIMSSIKLTIGKHLKGVSYNFRAHADPNFTSISDSLNEHHGCVATDDTGTFVDGLFKDATTKEYFKDDIVELIRKDFLD